MDVLTSTDDSSILRVVTVDCSRCDITTLSDILLIASALYIVQVDGMKLKTTKMSSLHRHSFYVMIIIESPVLINNYDHYKI